MLFQLLKNLDTNTTYPMHSNDGQALLVFLDGHWYFMSNDMRYDGYCPANNTTGFEYSWILENEYDISKVEEHYKMLEGNFIEGIDYSII